MFIPQTSKSSMTMAEASSTAVSSSPCHLGGITRLVFAPDGQYVSFYTFADTPLPFIHLVFRDLERDVMRRVKRLTFRTIFTGGSDCLVRIHKANEPDSEPGFHDNHEDAVTSLTCEVSQRLALRQERCPPLGGRQEKIGIKLIYRETR